MPVGNLPDLLKQALVTVIQKLNPDADERGFTLGGRVYGQMLPDESNVTFPCVIVTSEGEREELLPGTSESIRRVYPYRVFIADRHGTRDHARDAQYRSWRRAILETFHQKRALIDLVPGCYWCEVAPEVVYDQKLPQYQHVVSGMVVRCYTTEPRYRGPEAAAPGAVAAPQAGGN